MWKKLWNAIKYLTTFYFELRFALKLQLDKLPVCYFAFKSLFAEWTCSSSLVFHCQVQSCCDLELYWFEGFVARLLLMPVCVVTVDLSSPVFSWSSKRQFHFHSALLVNWMYNLSTHATKMPVKANKKASLTIIFYGFCSILAKFQPQIIIVFSQFFLLLSLIKLLSFNTEIKCHISRYQIQKKMNRQGMKTNQLRTLSLMSLEEDFRNFKISFKSSKTCRK